MSFNISTQCDITYCKVQCQGAKFFHKEFEFLSSYQTVHSAKLRIHQSIPEDEKYNEDDEIIM